MKKMIILTILLGLFLLSGCESIKKDVKYECQVSVRPTGKEPCNFIGGKDHICQLYGKSFEPNDVPDFCTEECLERSKFLTLDSGWGHAIDLECIEVSLAHSGFAKPDLTPEERRIKTVKLTYEDVEDEEEEEYDANSDISNCFDLGKCWIDGSCKDCGEGECQFDSDCAPICEGNFLVKRWCNLHTAKCEPQAETFWTDCTTQEDIIAGMEVSRVCKGSACVIDESSLQISRNDLRDQYNEYSYARQEITELRLKFNRDCLKALSDVTSELIVESSLLISGFASSSISHLISEMLENTLDYGMNKLAKGDKALMSREQYIAWACSMDKQLTKELKEIDEKQEKVLEQIKEIESR